MIIVKIIAALFEIEKLLAMSVSRFRALAVALLLVLVALQGARARCSQRIFASPANQWTNFVYAYDLAPLGD